MKTKVQRLDLLRKGNGKVEDGAEEEAMDLELVAQGLVDLVGREVPPVEEALQGKVVGVVGAI